MSPSQKTGIRYCIRYCMNGHLSGSKESIDSTTTTFPSIWTMIIHTSYWSVVFSCLEVVLKHDRTSNNTAKTVRCEEDRGKNGSATSIAIIYLLVVAHKHDMKASTEKTCHNEITELLWQEFKKEILNMLMNWQSEWENWLVHTEQKRSSIYHIIKAEREELPRKKNCTEK